MTKRAPKNKYSIKDLESIPQESRLISSILMIANQLHEIGSMLKEMKDRK